MRILEDLGRDDGCLKERVIMKSCIYEVETPNEDVVKETLVHQLNNLNGSLIC